MKSLTRSTSARVLAGLPFFLVSIFLIVLATSDLWARARASARKVSGHRVTSVNAPAAVPVPFMGTYTPTVFPCATPLNGPFAVLPTDLRIIVQVSATIPTNDLTLTLLYEATAGTAVPVAGPEDTG